MKRFLVAFVSVALLASPLAAPVTAGDNDVIREGSCSGRSSWKVKLSPDNGRLEVEFEVDQNVNGRTWQVRLFHNGDRFFAGSRTTQGPSGSFTVRRVTSNAAGADTVRARAVNVSTDELCRGSASF